MINSVMGEFEFHEDLQLSIDTQGDTLCFVIFVSYAEIYNDFIYDLLSDKAIHRCPSLKLAADKNGNHYIKGTERERENLSSYTW